MKPEIDKRCGTCGHVEWPRSKRGRRMKKDRVGKCLCPLPPIPQCFFTYQSTDKHGKLYKDAVFAKRGENCETWKPEEK